MTFQRPLAAIALLTAIPAAHAQTSPIALGDGVTLAPLLDARLRWEAVDTPTRTAHAETLRLRTGAELADATSHLSLLVEGTSTLPFGSAYSAFSYASSSDQYRPGRATIADGASLGLNRLQLRYATKPVTLTIGRQRIQIEDQRFVGNGPWRQNEQTFDAVRAQLAHGALVLDATRARRVTTVNGSDGAPRDAFDGRFTFVTGGLVTPSATVKGFAYLLDYDTTPFLNQSGARSQLDSSQTYGFLSKVGGPLGHGIAVTLVSSFARQSAYGRNPNRYRATYTDLEGALTVAGHTATLARETLGADAGARGGTWSFQTPLSSLHKFNGWADVFLTTPANGLRDTSVTISGKLPAVKSLPRITYTVANHWFAADLGGAHYGKEINASLGFTLHRINWLAKITSYRAQDFGSDTRKLWLQAEFIF